MELEDLIIKIDELKEELDGLRPLREDRLNKLIQKLKLDWNYHSNSIEGNTLTKSETKSFILWGITAKGKPFRDYVEMKGHNDALNKLYEIVNQGVKITENLIKEFHKLILVEPYSDKEAEINPGEWKKFPNYLYSPMGERIDFVAPEDVPQRMNALINWLNNHIDPPKRKRKKYDLHPLLIAAGFHAEFLRIHPFGDGNGRMARILTNLILMLCGYTPVIIKLDTRNDYYSSINMSSLDQPKMLAIFLGKEILKTLELTIQAAKGESIDDEEDINKELEILQQRIVEKQKKRRVKSLDIVHEVMANICFPFIEKLIHDLEKYKNLFEESGHSLFLNNEMNNEAFELWKQKKEFVHKEIDIKNAQFNYVFNRLKKTYSKIKIEIKLEIEFKKHSYLIKDNIVGQEREVGYGEKLSREEQRDWALGIQKGILKIIEQTL
ncbi:MAG: Fic family protein [Bacteroidia bacterium]